MGIVQGLYGILRARTMSDLEKIPAQEVVSPNNETISETPEQIGVLEVVSEKKENKDVSLEEVSNSSTPLESVAVSSSVKDETTKSVEGVLEDGLEDTYKNLSPDVQKKFRSEGEKVTNEIAEMVRKTNVKAQKVLKLIREWLKVIPHINRYFLDQEAKIKTDKIMHLEDENHDIL